MEYNGIFINFKVETEGIKQGYGPHTGYIHIILENNGGAGMEVYSNNIEGKIIFNSYGEYEYDDMIHGLETIVNYLKQKRDE